MSKADKNLSSGQSVQGEISIPSAKVVSLFLDTVFD